jgi:nucleoside-diphosphate-sugar epimerase
MTRHRRSAPGLADLGATAVVCDIFETDALRQVLAAASPDVVINQVTDLPDTRAAVALKVRGLNRARRQGTDNLVAAAQAAGAAHFVAQSTAFPLPAIAQRAVDYLEDAVLGVDGVVLRYGLFYGPGTWYADAPDGDAVVHIDEAARRTVDLLTAPSGIVDVVDPAIR